MGYELFLFPFILLFAGQTFPVNISPRVILSSRTAVGTDWISTNITGICRPPVTATLAHKVHDLGLSYRISIFTEPSPAIAKLFLGAVVTTDVH